MATPIFLRCVSNPQLLIFLLCENLRRSPKHPSNPETQRNLLKLLFPANPSRVQISPFSDGFPQVCSALSWQVFYWLCGGLLARRTQNLQVRLDLRLKTNPVNAPRHHN